MARTFTGSTANYLSGSAPIADVGSTGITMASWFRGNPSSAAGQAIMAMFVTGSWFRLTYQSNVTGDPIRAQIQVGATSNFADTTTGVSDSGWHHAACVLDTNRDITVYLDGGNSAFEGASAPGAVTFSTMYLGIQNLGAGVTQPLNGALAWPCVWSAQLSAGEMLALSNGAHPLTIQPENIVAYWPLTGGSTTDEVDIIGGFTQTETGTVGSAESPLVAIGWPSNVIASAAAAPGGFQPAWAARSTVTIVGGVAA